MHRSRRQTWGESSTSNQNPSSSSSSLCAVAEKPVIVTVTCAHSMHCKLIMPACQSDLVSRPNSDPQRTGHTLDS